MSLAYYVQTTLDYLGRLLFGVGVIVIIAGLSVAYFNNPTPLEPARLILYHLFSGGMIVFAGVLLHPNTYTEDNIDGFKERSPRAIWAALFLCAFAIYLLPYFD